MSVLMLSLLLIALILVGMFMSKPVQEHFYGGSGSAPVSGSGPVPDNLNGNRISVPGIAPTTEMIEKDFKMGGTAFVNHLIPQCRYLKDFSASDQLYLTPYCDYINTNYANNSVSTLSNLLKYEDRTLPVNEDVTQLQQSLEQKCQRLAENTSPDQTYWKNLCNSLEKSKDKRQLDTYAQQPYDQGKECEDMSQYVKLDEVPCWNCSLP